MDTCPVALYGAFGEFDEERVRNNCLKGVKWSPDGCCLLTASEDQLLRVFELPSEEPGGEECSATTTEMRSVLRAREGDAIYDYSWYPRMDSSDPTTCCFVSASRDHPLHLWDAYTGHLRASYSAHNHLDEVASGYSCAFDLTGGQIYCGSDRAVRVFDVSRPGRECSLRRTSKTKKSRVGQRGIISSFAFAPDFSGLFAAGSYAGTTGLNVDNSPEMICLLGGHSGGVTQLAFSHDALHLFSAARRDGSIHCWDVRNTCQILYSFARACPTNQRIGFHLAPDSRALISASQDGRVLAFDTAHPGTDPVTWLSYPNAVNDAVLHPALPLLAVAVGERRFPLPSGGEGQGHDGEDVDGVEDEHPGHNGFTIWQLPQSQPAQPELEQDPSMSVVS